MDSAMAAEAQRHAIDEVQQPHSDSAAFVVDLGRPGQTNFAVEMVTEILQARCAVPS